MTKKIKQPLEPGLAAFYSFVAILVPPLAVGMAEGCTSNIALNLLLWILGVVPGWIHAFYIISARVRGPVVPLVSLPQHQQQAYHQQQQQLQQGYYQPNGAYYDANRLESQLQATVIGPMKAGRMPEGATIHINPFNENQHQNQNQGPHSPPRYIQGAYDADEAPQPDKKESAMMRELKQ